MTFNGEYQHGIDDKGRLILPAKFRESLGARHMLVKGFEACLFIYPMEAWARLEEKLNALNSFSRRNRDFKRQFFSGSDDREIDKQGRTLINYEFRSHAKLTKEVYIIGAGDHLEIWDKDVWEGYRGGLEKDFETLAEEMFS